MHTDLDVHEIVQLGRFGLFRFLVRFLEASTVRIHFAILKQFQLHRHLNRDEVREHMRTQHFSSMRDNGKKTRGFVIETPKGKLCTILLGINSVKSYLVAREVVVAEAQDFRVKGVALHAVLPQGLRPLHHEHREWALAVPIPKPAQVRGPEWQFFAQTRGAAQAVVHAGAPESGVATRSAVDRAPGGLVSQGIVTGGLRTAPRRLAHLNQAVFGFFFTRCEAHRIGAKARRSVQKRLFQMRFMMMVLVLAGVGFRLGLFFPSRVFFPREEP